MAGWEVAKSVDKMSTEDKSKFVKAMSRNSKGVQDYMHNIRNPDEKSDNIVRVYKLLDTVCHQNLNF